MKVDVQNRYSAEALAGVTGSETWDPALVDTVVSPFTSRAVAAVKPE